MADQILVQLPGNENRAMMTDQTQTWPHLPPDATFIGHSSLQELQLQAYDAIKEKDLVKLVAVLDQGLDSNHCFTGELPPGVRGESLLQLAVKEDFISAVELLLFGRKKRLEDTLVQMAFLFSMKHNLMDSFRLILLAVIRGYGHMESTDAFRHAMYKMQYDLVEQLVQIPDFHINFEATWGLDRPLHIVVHHGQVQLARLLLDKGAVVDAMDRKGTTPLIVACSFMSIESTKLLLQHGADASHKACRDLYPHHSPLHATYRFSRDEDTAQSIIELLLDAGLELRKETWLCTQASEFTIPPHVHAYLQYLSRQPKTLSSLCFLAVRNHLSCVHFGISIWPLVGLLPVGPIMKKYLRLEPI